MLKRPTAVNLENDSKTTRKKDENNTKKKGNQNEENSREKAAMLYWVRGCLSRGKGGAVSRPHQRVEEAEKQQCPTGDAGVSPAVNCPVCAGVSGCAGVPAC